MAGCLDGAKAVTKPRAGGGGGSPVEAVNSASSQSLLLSWSNIRKPGKCASYAWSDTYS